MRRRHLLQLSLLSALVSLLPRRHAGRRRRRGAAPVGWLGHC
ncbi:MAG: hypothetical protein RMK29_08485 [Myxococcales bacterium]|nr:hypothetical protein [Myxococcota bacterium]MDW8281732.1 hypothetical protein [Myxococcales bacterium]